MLLERLPEHGVELHLGLPRSRPPDPLRPGWRVTLLRPARGLRWWLAPLAFVPYVARCLRRERVDLLRGHSVLFTGPSLLLARRLSRRRPPIVLHHHHLDGSWTRLHAAILRRADAVVTLSERSRAEVVACGVDPARVHVVPSGVEAIDVAAAPAGTWPGGGLRLLYLGRLIERKRPELALEALSLLAARGVEASLVVAGDGPVRRRLEERARELSVERLVAWRRDVGQREKWSLYRAADVLLFPSALEGFGLVPVEAQAAGLPVVATAGTATA